MYRDEGGIKSFMLDDDMCDCKSSLSMGHAMCSAGCSNDYGDCSVPGGVDLLRDDGCEGPGSDHGLALYWRVYKYSGVEFGLESAHGGGWTRWWWYNAGTSFPADKTDVFGDEAGSCSPSQAVCFQKLPGGLNEGQVEIMAADNVGTVYKWRFDPNNHVAHGAFLAMTQGTEIQHGAIGQQNWHPTVLQGDDHPVTQDAVMYRVEGGIKSFMLDDDMCDCKSSLSMGHAMCSGGCSNSYGNCDIPGGVDLLRDDGCEGPGSDHGLAIYYRVLPYTGVEL